MILETCLALLVLALACLCLACSRAAIALLTASLLLLELAGSGLLAQALLPLVRLANPIEAISWAPHSTIVVLGGGTTAPTRIDGQPIPSGVKKVAFSRIIAGARAWRACHAHGADCAVIVSGGDPSGHGASEASVYAPVLAGLGIPTELIRQESASNTTWENARNTTRVVPQSRQLVVVTSGIHLTRALKSLENLKWVSEIRQCGFIAGIDVMCDPLTNTPFPWQELTGARICQVARHHGLLTRPILDTLVLMPPFCISTVQIDVAVEALFRSIQEVCEARYE